MAEGVSRMRDKWSTGDIRKLSSRLQKEYGSPRHYNKDDPLDELVFIVLSSKTSERGYMETYDSLKTAFPEWEEILRAKPRDVIRHIERGGLAFKKEKWLRDLLRSLMTSNGKVDLSRLRSMNTQEAEAFLTSLPGVGLKTARCVLMYSVGREVFPVDSHCRRILARLGVIEHKRLSDHVQNEIQSKIPPDLRYPLHVNLVAHGRAVCRARNPDCNNCSISPNCQYRLLHPDAR